MDEFTIARALYGDLVVTFRAGEEGFPHDLNRKPNGYFMGTSRVSAVVIAKTHVEADGVRVDREVFPTNNPNAMVLIEKIDRYVQSSNRRAQPFVWTATADSIFAKVERLCERIYPVNVKRDTVSRFQMLVAVQLSLTGS